MPSDLQQSASGSFVKQEFPNGDGISAGASGNAVVWKEAVNSSMHELSVRTCFINLLETSE